MLKADHAAAAAVYPPITMLIGVFKEPKCGRNLGYGPVRDTSPSPHNAFLTGRETRCERMQDTEPCDRGLARQVVRYGEYGAKKIQ